MKKKIKQDPIKTFIDKRSQDGLQTQQIITYIIATCMASVGMPMHLFHIIGADVPVLRALSIISLGGGHWLSSACGSSKS